MQIKNWALIEESNGGSKLPAGGYVCRITAVEDVPSKEYLNITYDIVEGQYAGHYSDDFAQKNPYIHQFVRSYKQSAEGMFKAFLSRLEESNNGRGGGRAFSIANWQVHANEQEFVGLDIGLVMQYEKYTNGKGEDKERLNVERVYATQDIRNGDFKVPEPKDSRTTVPAAASSYDSYGDVPFGAANPNQLTNQPSWA